MLISLGDNQFISANGKDLVTEQGYVGHFFDCSSIPEEAVVEIRKGTYHDGDKFVEEISKVLFKGTKEKFLLWQEEHNGW